MKLISTDLQDWADRIQAEINADEGVNDWFWPKSRSHEIFEEAWMKFVNRNLNYFSFPSIIASVREGNQFNPALPETFKFLSLCKNTKPRACKITIWQNVCMAITSR